MVAGSFAFGFALVPLYDVICEAAGIRVNAAPSAIQASESGVGREVALEFLSMVPPGREFELTPATRPVHLPPANPSEAQSALKSRATRPYAPRAAATRRRPVDHALNGRRVVGAQCGRRVGDPTALADPGDHHAAGVDRVVGAHRVDREHRVGEDPAVVIRLGVADAAGEEAGDRRPGPAWVGADGARTRTGGYRQRALVSS